MEVKLKYRAQREEEMRKIIMNEQEVTAALNNMEAQRTGQQSSGRKVRRK